MEEKNHKQKLHIKFKQIVDWLTKRDISLGIDKEISEDQIIFFNGFITEEGFEYEILETQFPQLLSELEEFEFYELDQSKLKEVKRHMADRILNFIPDLFEDLVFKDKLDHMDKKHVEIVNSFIQKQEKLRFLIANKLTDNLDNSQKHKKYARLKWNGTQTQLSELFKTLLDRGWIDMPLVKAEFVNTICEMFMAGNDETMNKNIKDYFHRDKYIFNNNFSEIKSISKKI